MGQFVGPRSPIFSLWGLSRRHPGWGSSDFLGGLLALGRFDHRSILAIFFFFKFLSLKKQAVLEILQLWSKQDQESVLENHKCSLIQIQCENVWWAKMAGKKWLEKRNTLNWHLSCPSVSFDSPTKAFGVIWGSLFCVTSLEMCFMYVSLNSLYRTVIFLFLHSLAMAKLSIQTYFGEYTNS